MTEEEAVRRANEEWIAAVNSGNLDDCVSRLTDDVAFLPPNDLLLAGKDAFETWGGEVFGQGVFHMTLKETNAWVSGDLACLWGKARIVVYRMPEKKPTEGLVKWVHVFKRQLDGSWKMALNTWNSDSLFPMN